MQGGTRVAAAISARLSAGVVVVNLANRKLNFLLLRAYRNWDFPKGIVERGETPIDAALREVLEETSLNDISFDWGPIFIETGPYRKDKIARYYIARSKQRHVELQVNPALGHPEHHEACWVIYEKALAMVTPRLKPVVQWAYATVNHLKVRP
jgi:8-oxo-dGTP pyrophosphatase MutT (NUDIX family)